ncbi:hypothetical protein LTR36_005075 [Oleoguttula mirabilis]|uniref:F-box domain-containing protein n=1 Tax=Oleoguttula mirabilis TaxID=1507867 RepID=A0AAV9JVL7_9PEZI|nr:hypothetical protein LTR36_005075 [Oleoguttula mirabilis]
MAYWNLPLPEDQHNKSELQAIIRGSERRIPNVNALKGHQLAEIVKRMQKGLRLHLHGDSTYDELYAEVQESSQHMLPGGKPTRKDLVDVLDAFESERTFHQFTDLPPELRQHIYAYTFSYNDSAYHVQQPAIARASRLLRTESLPVFYEVNRFGLHMERTGPRQLMTDYWPFYVSNVHIAMMRRLEVNLLTDKTRVRIKIDLPTPRGDALEIAVWSLTPEKYMTTQALRQCQQLVECQIRPVVEALLQSPGIDSFTTREIAQIALSVPLSTYMTGAKPNERLRI